jgi:hypothetical protein
MPKALGVELNLNGIQLQQKAPNYAGIRLERQRLTCKRRLSGVTP